MTPAAAGTNRQPAPLICGDGFRSSRVRALFFARAHEAATDYDGIREAERMSAAISVLASDAPSAVASLYGTFDASNRDFLERHLRALTGDVVIDCTKVSSIDDDSLALLDEFREHAARERRRVVIRFGAELACTTRGGAVP